MTEEGYLELWHMALHKPMRVKLLHGDLTRLKATLYSARANNYSPDLAGVEVRTSPLSPKDTLWLGVKGFMEGTVT